MEHRCPICNTFMFLLYRMNFGRRIWVSVSSTYSRILSSSPPFKVRGGSWLTRAANLRPVDSRFRALGSWNP